MVTGAKDINIDYGYGRARGPDKSLGSSPGPEIIMVLGCKQAIYLGPLSQASPLLICLFPQDISHCVSLGHILECISSP